MCWSDHTLISDADIRHHNTICFAVTGRRISGGDCRDKNIFAILSLRHRNEVGIWRDTLFNKAADHRYHWQIFCKHYPYSCTEGCKIQHLVCLRQYFGTMHAKLNRIFAVGQYKAEHHLPAFFGVSAKNSAYRPGAPAQRQKRRAGQGGRNKSTFTIS